MSSSYRSSLGKVVRSKSRGVSSSAYACATRRGVSAKWSSAVDWPSAASRSPTAASAASRSIASVWAIRSGGNSDTAVDITTSRDAVYRILERTIETGRHFVN
jgi:hypothetical protein